MLLGSINSIDYALDVVTNNKQNEIDLDKNTYENLNQDENFDLVTNSNAINFNNDSSNPINKNENLYIIPRRKRESLFSINNIFY